MRKQAEARLEKTSQPVDNLSRPEIKTLIHDYQVYQIELELQNEELRETQKQLELARDRYARLFNDAPVGYLTVDESGIIAQTNETFAGMVGREPSYLSGKALADFIDPAERSAFYGRFKAFFKNPQGKHLDFRLYGKKGSPAVRCVGRMEKDIQVQPGKDTRQHLLFILTDISEQVRAEEARRESEERYRLLSEVTLEGIVIHKNGVVRDLNPALSRLCGYEREELLGVNILELLVHEEDQDIVRSNIVKEYAQPYTVRAIKKSGETFYTELEARNFETRGEILRVAAVRDITRRKLAEQEIAQINEQLQQAQKMESVGILAGGVAHDFNNLLHVMRGNIELLARTPSIDPQGSAQLKSVTTSLDRAARLVQQLLLFSRKVESGREPVDLNQEVHEAAQMLERTIPKMVALELRLDPEVHPISGDPVQVEQALLNLANNAVDAMPEGGRLIIETSNVELDANFVGSHPGSTVGRHVLLTVTDTGCGMDEATLKQVFDPFFTTKEVGQGTGLGLASVYGIVKIHGGYIHCSSEPGQGTTFRIYLPAAKGDEPGPDAPDQLETATTVSMDGDQGGQTILVVDDEREIRELTQEALEDFGYAVHSAANGEEALAIYREHNQTIDLILLDLNMPGMGGHKCLQELIRIDPAVRVVIASGYSAKGQARETLSSGATGFIGKPYQLKELEAAVREALGKE